MVFGGYGGIERSGGGGGGWGETVTQSTGRWGGLGACPPRNFTLRLILAVEGPELSSVPFEEILDIFKEQDRRIELNSLLLC